MSREGNLEAPTRHPIAWRDADFWDEAKLDAELRRVFDLCHGCRRCFNLCDSFPRLFDLVDAAGEAEIKGVKSADFAQVVDACTLCDMCFLTKCPYVPPHEFNIDFPHLMLRARAVDFKNGRIGALQRRLNETDANGKLGCGLHGLANWATDRGNTLTRGVMQAVAGVHKDADLPKYAAERLTAQAAAQEFKINEQAPAHGRKVAIFATCFGEYNTPDIGLATARVLAHNGVAVEFVYPGCCGMPQLEQGDIARVADNAKRIAVELGTWVDQGYDIVALVPSCALMLKFEWPLIEPDDAHVAKLSKAVFDVAEYVMDIADKEGLVDGLTPVEGGVTLHSACHARAQNMGPKAAQMLRKIPDTKVALIDRCSGHGGAWGVRTENFAVALKIGRPVVETAAKKPESQLCSECPLAGDHIAQGLETTEAGRRPSLHPIQVLAKAYGLTTD